MQLIRGQTRLFQELTAGRVLRRLTGLKVTAGQAPPVRRGGRVFGAVLQEYRTGRIDKQHERD